MEKKTAQKKSIWNSILKIVLILVSSFATSQVATTNPIIDLAVKNAIVQTSNVLLEVMSSDSQDSAILITEKSQTVQTAVQTSK